MQEAAQAGLAVRGAEYRLGASASGSYQDIAFDAEGSYAAARRFGNRRVHPDRALEVDRLALQPVDAVQPDDRARNRERQVRERQLQQLGVRHGAGALPGSLYQRLGDPAADDGVLRPADEAGVPRLAHDEVGAAAQYGALGAAAPGP